MSKKKDDVVLEEIPPDEKYDELTDEELKKIEETVAKQHANKIITDKNGKIIRTVDVL